MKHERAMMAGLAGAVVMSAVLAAFRYTGVPADLESILGSLFISSPGNTRWLVGFALHLGMGAVIAWLYAAAFEFAIQCAGPLVGAGLGLSHGLLAELCMSGIQAMYPDHGAFFLRNILLGSALFIMLHVLFGAVVGILYGLPLQKPHILDTGTTRS